MTTKGSRPNRKESDYEGDNSGTTVESEASKKKMKSVRRRRHLILLAQDQEGLQNIFKMISTNMLGTTTSIPSLTIHFSSTTKVLLQHLLVLVVHMLETVGKTATTAMKQSWQPCANYTKDATNLW